MDKPKKLLIAEDELTNSILLKRLMVKAGYEVVTVNNGLAAYKALEKEKFDALLTDWMMPNMDGIELICKIRKEMTEIPFIVMITALVTEGSRNLALESGADDFIAKPIDVDEFLPRLQDGLRRKEQGENTEDSFVGDSIDIIAGTDVPHCVGVGIATSTGGPQAVIELLKDIPADVPAAFGLVQHGPDWMLETFAARLQKECKLKVSIAKNGDIIKRGHVYIAPGDKHMVGDKGSACIRLDEGPKVNFVRPAADPMLNSIVESFGKYSVAVVLTGLGKDGVRGAVQVAKAGGKVLIQDPADAIAPAMPKAVIESGIEYKKAGTYDLSKSLLTIINDMYKEILDESK